MMSYFAGSRDLPVEESGFLQLIPGSDEKKPYRGGTLRLVSIELYGNGILLTWLSRSYSLDAYAVALDALRQEPNFIRDVENALAHEREWEREHGRQLFHPPPQPPRWVPEEWTAISKRIEFAVAYWLVPIPQITDDRGNSYHVRSGTFSGRAPGRRTFVLQPGVGRDVRVLTVHFDDVSFTVPIPNRAWLIS